MLKGDFRAIVSIVKRQSVHSLFPAMLLSVATTCFAIAADTPNGDDNPFRHIVERNVFALKDPPPPPDPNDLPAAPPPPLAKVVLTGIWNVLGPARALLEVTETEPGKQQPSGQPKKMMLRESEREGSIEVLSIDIAKNVVRIRNGMVETNLTFEAVKQGPGGPLAGGPGALPSLNPNNPNAPPPLPGATPPEPGSRRGTIVVGGNQGNAGANTAAQNAYNNNVSGSQFPSRQIRTPGAQPQNAATQDPVVQWVQMKAEEERARKSRVPFPAPPPVPGADQNGNR